MNFNSFIPNAFAQNIDPKEVRTQQKNSKIESNILNTIQNPQSSRLSAIQNPSNTIQVVVVLNNASDEYMEILSSYNITIETTYENLVQATVPYSELENLANLDFVNYIRKPIELVPTIVSEGAAVISSNLLNNAGITGQNVKVAVLDLGFDITDPEISGNIVESISFRGDGDITGGSDANKNHGTATSQIVVDVAPDVELFLYNSATGVEFLSMVDFILNNRQIDIFSISAGFFNNVGPIDGTSIIAQKVNEVRSSGILWVNAAGNHADKHWQGQFSDTDFDNFHNFQGVDETITIDVSPGILVVHLSWDDWVSPSQDFDLLLLDASLNLVDLSINDQVTGFPPTETVAALVPFPTTANIAILKFSATRNVNFQLYSTVFPLSEYQVSSSSLLIPADATGSFTVGAMDFSNDLLEDFSSRGPTLDGRIKPDISAPDGVTTSTFSFFPGTSAAAPYVAGAAALLKEKFPTASADDLQNLLEFTTASFHSKSNDDGTGRVDLSKFVSSDILALDNSNVNCAVVNTCYFPNTITVNQGDTVNWVNSDDAAITITSGNSIDGPDGTFDSGLLLSGTTFSHTFNTAGTFDYFDAVHPWASGQVIVNALLVPCSPPGSGDWIITSSCTLTSSSTAPGNVIIQNNSVLTIPSGVTLDIDFVNNFLKIKSGSGILIRAGGTIT